MAKIEPKILKGTRDFLPLDMAKRNLVLNTLRRVFEKFGYDQIETPILCSAETLLGKYGDEGDRLTYSFETKGGTKIALPYDLTVPFARQFAANYRDLPIPFKRYQIQRVWRAERPQKGRLREFYQCDIDVIGTRSLIAEAEIARVTYAFFREMKFNFVIKVNSRRLMNSILKEFGVSEDISMDVIRVIDKLVKIGEEAVEEELEKLKVKDASGLIAALKPGKDNKATLGSLGEYDLKEMETFLKYCKEMGVPDEFIVFDPSLARGLDYYTGVTYEVVDLDESGGGSLAGGGRYDDLCGMFCDEDFSGVGISFGLERIMMVLEERGYFKDLKMNCLVLVTLFDDEASEDALGIYNELVTAGINCEVYFEVDKLKKQFKYADKKMIPFVVVRGPEEREKDEVSVKAMGSGKQKNIPRNQLVSYLEGYIHCKK